MYYTNLHHLLDADVNNYCLQGMDLRIHADVKSLASKNFFEKQNLDLMG